MNKRGWIKIVEAFIAVLLIAGVLLFVINKGYIGKTDISEQVYQVQLSVLREIELDNTLREKVLSTTIDGEVPIEIVEKITQRVPDYLACKPKICQLDVICSLEDYIDTDVYAQAVVIAAQGDTYDPKQLKLFCWTAA
jgi:hypothetical protein